MRRVVLGWLGFCGIGVLACGGQVTRQTREDSGGNPSGVAGNGGSKAGSTLGNPDTELGECVEGPVEGSAEATGCAWVAAGHCYGMRDMACNCACPHTRDSQCVSGFGNGPDGHVTVDCF